MPGPEDFNQLPTPDAAQAAEQPGMIEMPEGLQPTPVETPTAAQPELITQVPGMPVPQSAEGSVELSTPLPTRPTARAIGLPAGMVRGPQLGSFREAPAATPDTITEFPFAKPEDH